MSDSVTTSGQPPIIIVTGPTASGKSGLALALARRFDGAVINADALQVYRELEILTARPGPADLAAAPHRLYGMVPGSESCSAGVWRDMALEVISAVQGAGKLPILVGGTGLYLRALVRGLAPLPAIPAGLRAAAQARHAALGPMAFHDELAARDPALAARLAPGDRQRLLRAWEVLEATGRSLAQWQAEQPVSAPPFTVLRLVLLPERAALYQAIDGRFERMLAAGALDEVRRLLGLGLSPAQPVMKALGVPELARHLAGTLPLEDAVAAAQQSTRRYAKRQMTWLRGQTPADPAAVAQVMNAQYSESLAPKIFKNIDEFLLTHPR